MMLYTFFGNSHLLFFHFLLGVKWVIIFPNWFICRYELLFYPRYHLDQSSLLCRKPLLAKPMVMDVYENYILVTYRPFDVHIFHVKLTGELTPSSNPDLQVNDFLSKFLLWASDVARAVKYFYSVYNLSFSCTLDRVLNKLYSIHC